MSTKQDFVLGSGVRGLGQTGHLRGEALVILTPGKAALVVTGEGEALRRILDHRMMNLRMNEQLEALVSEALVKHSASAQVQPTTPPITGATPAAPVANQGGTAEPPTGMNAAVVVAETPVTKEGPTPEVKDTAKPTDAPAEAGADNRSAPVQNA